MTLFLETAYEISYRITKILNNHDNMHSSETHKLSLQIQSQRVNHFPDNLFAVIDEEF
jgi:hypothetical protein